MTAYQRTKTGEISSLHALSAKQREHFRTALLPPEENAIDEVALKAAIGRYEAGEYSFERLVIDGSSQRIMFNVMPDAAVEEELRPRCYFVGVNIARAVFDRSYATSMSNSPSHVIFMSALVQWQKLLYLLMCHRSGVEYRPTGPELFKIWPTEVRCRMPTLVREEHNITQDAFLSSIEKVGADVWEVEGFAVVNKRIGLVGRAQVHRIG
ncbi:MAG: hypothetical protein RIE56_13555 [Amphiplicatus sp.]